MPSEISSGGRSFSEIYGKLWERLEAGPTQDILFSILFAPPGSDVISEVRSNFAYLNLRSGTEWDLYLAGYSPGIKPRREPRQIASFDPLGFRSVVADVESYHRRALSSVADQPPGLVSWKYSGVAEMASFMAYRTEGSPHVDWLSMRTAKIGNNGAVETIGEVVEKLSDWRAEDAKIGDLAPGELLASNSLFSVAPALSFLAMTITEGVIGNAAYELLHKIIS
jgi:hypothetical protein